MTTEQALREALQAVIAAHEAGMQELGERMRAANQKTLTVRGQAAIAAFDAIEKARAALALPTAAPVGEREAFESYYWGDAPVNYSNPYRPESPEWIAYDAWQARATLPTQRSSMDGLPKPFGYVSDGFADGLRFQHNPWPVEHTLLHSTLPVFSAAAVQQFKEDAKRYRWLADSNNYYEAINLISDGSLTEDALGKAIDAAMAQGVKG